MSKMRIKNVLPLSALQEGLLFHSLLEEQVDVYNIQVVFELEGMLRKQDLRRACETLLVRHPNLMAGFRRLADGRPVQVIPQQLDLPWTELNLHGDPHQLDTALAQEYARRFDL